MDLPSESQARQSAAEEVEKEFSATEKTAAQKGRHKEDAAPDGKHKTKPTDIRQITDPKKVAGNTSNGSLGIGDLAKLQKQLDEDRSRLQLFVLKAKQEHEDKRETKDRRERRELEYYKASFGEPCGPNNRFLLEAELGKGAFSTVFRGRDSMQDKEYAIKFIRQNVMLRKATEREIKLMRRLRKEAAEVDPDGASCLLGLAGSETFEHEGHLALVFQLQRCDLRSGLQRYGRGHGLPLQTVQSYAKNIFLALRALWRVKVIHSDLKPDNLLISLDKSSVKLSDFGSAMTHTDRIRTEYLQPRFYRAPEVILGQPYSMQIDMWSAGATLYEIASGRVLFERRTNNGMIHEMLKVCGAFPKSFATAGHVSSKHFTADGSFKLLAQESATGTEALLTMSDFPRPEPPITGKLEKALQAGAEGSVLSARQQGVVKHLGLLIARCLFPVPAGRLTPESALEQRFFQLGLGASAP